ncbi:MAG: carbohydrate kinase family protein [Opitutales bacterium]
MNPVNQPRRGILAAGNWIIDHVKRLDHFPEQDGLASILEERDGNGGCAYNLLKGLAKLETGLPLFAAGCTGDDADGARIREDCRIHGIDTQALAILPDVPTSYTDVMTDSRTGRRTFFHHRGANARLSPEHIPVGNTPARLLALGYFGLLDALDADNGAGHARVLNIASDAGLITAADLVSTPADFASIVGPSLPHLDYLVLNEWEAARLKGSGDEPAPEDGQALADLAASLCGKGVRGAVVIHTPAGAVAVEADGTRHTQPAVDFPSNRIRGSAGAGDAFFAGLLYGIHEAWPLAQSLRLAVCSGAASLEAPTCSDSLRPWARCLDLGESLGFQRNPAWPEAGG